MKAITLTCPQCGAALRAEPSSPTVTCEYCHTTSQVQRRTGVFSRPQPPAQPPMPPSGPPLNMPVATQTKSLAPVFAMIVVIAIAGAVVPLAFRSSSSCKPEAVLELERPSWSGLQAGALVDLNGDGVDDIVGRMRVIQPSMRTHVGAIDGKTGDQLWISEAFGEQQNAHQAPLAVVDGVAVLGDGSAGLAGFDTRDGSTRWKIRLNEKVVALCAGKDGGVLVRTADDKGHELTVVDGGVDGTVPLGRGECARLVNDDMRGSHGVDVVLYSRRNQYRDRVPRRFEGVSVKDAIHHTPSGRTIALGYKQPGSRIGTLVSYDEGGHVLWKAQVPAGDPLAVKESEPEPDEVALTATHVVVAYETSETHVFRLTAFEAETGKRLWDVPLTGDRPLGAVFASATHAMVSKWGSLEVFDLATGARAYLLD